MTDDTTVEIELGESFVLKGNPGDITINFQNSSPHKRLGNIKTNPNSEVLHLAHTIFFGLNHFHLSNRTSYLDSHSFTHARQREMKHMDPK
jgi:hypothetical protein